MWSEVVLPLLLFWVLFLRKYVPIPIIDTELGKLRDEIADLRKRVTKLEAQLAAGGGGGGGGGGGAPPPAARSSSSPDAPPVGLRNRPGSIQTSKPAAAPSKDAGKKAGAKEKGGAPPSTPMTPEDVLLDDAFVSFTESEAELATRNDSMLEETMEEILDQKFAVATGTPTTKPGGRRF